VAGVILNRVGSARHEAMLRRALDRAGIRVLGAVPRAPGLAHPSRHLGLVQAGERPDLDGFLDRAADTVAASCDLAAIGQLARRMSDASPTDVRPPPAQVIAIASDAAFAFAYPHLLADWRAAGAEIRPFSPLADDPVPTADLVILPGGYPELHAGRLAAASRFMESLRTAADGTDIYGECGGYMVLGEALTDAQGQSHRMAGLLPLATSFAERRLHLGYRTAEARRGPFPGRHSAHEFHYATTLHAEGPPLFDTHDAEGRPLPPAGLIRGRVCGSFLHLIDRDRLRPLSSREAQRRDPGDGAGLPRRADADDLHHRRAGRAVAGRNACFATLPISLIVLGSMLSATPLSALMQRYGRRAGFFAGAAGGSLGRRSSARYGLMQANFRSSCSARC
jgi:cobyrinic acid a,c-diamide synthase